MRLLVVEDEKRIAENLRIVLTKQSYVVDVVPTGLDGLHQIMAESYDVVIMDWMLGAMSGVEVCQQVRALGSRVPILMLTSRSQLEDKIEGLNTGADDYLTKPFAMEELLARVRALTRRDVNIERNPLIKVADLTVDTNRCLVMRAGEEIHLAPREYALLEYLARHQGEAQERLDLLSHVWGDEVDAFSNTVDVHIRYLRKKIDAGHAVPLIHTVKGKGYMLCAR